jgi:hypothetical protein
MIFMDFLTLKVGDFAYQFERLTVSMKILAPA